MVTFSGRCSSNKNQSLPLSLFPFSCGNFFFPTRNRNRTHSSPFPVPRSADSDQHLLPSFILAARHCFLPFNLFLIVFFSLLFPSLSSFPCQRFHRPTGVYLCAPSSARLPFPLEQNTPSGFPPHPLSQAPSGELGVLSPLVLLVFGPLNGLFFNSSSPFAILASDFPPPPHLFSTSYSEFPITGAPVVSSPAGDRDTPVLHSACGPKLPPSRVNNSRLLPPSLSIPLSFHLFFFNSPIR